MQCYSYTSSKRDDVRFDGIGSVFNISCRCCRSLGLAIVALAAAAASAEESTQESTQDQLVKALSGVFMVKEGGNVDAAQNSLRIFQVASRHTLPRISYAAGQVYCMHGIGPRN